MILATQIKHFLEAQGASFSVQNHLRTVTLEDAARQLGAPQGEVIRAVMLADHHGPLMLVLPLNYQIDFRYLREATDRDLQIMPRQNADQLFWDCEPGSHPPLGRAYRLPMLVDRSVDSLVRVYFEPGSHTSLIRMTGSEFRYTLFGMQRALVAQPIPFGDGKTSSWRIADANDRGAAHSQTTTSIDLEHRFGSAYALPQMPPIAQTLLEQAKEGTTDFASVAKEIEKDPHISEMVMRYARLKRYANQGKAENIDEVINHVLGFDTVSHIALGVAAGKAFQIPEDGPLGLKAFWRQAIFSAMLSEAIAEKISETVDVVSSTAYLSGLFHNIGILLLGHLFEPEYRLLNKMVAAHPKVPLTTLERRLIGMGQAQHVVCCGHAEIGAWLLRRWNMPDVVVDVAASHHCEHYHGPHQCYLDIVQLADRALKRHGIGDADTTGFSEAVLARLQIGKSEVLDLTDQIVHGSAEDMDRFFRSWHRTAHSG